MATIKDTVASHISTNWNGAVVCGSGSTPTIDAVGPEDIENPRDYDEAVLVYNERKIVKRRFNQNLYEDRVYAVPVTIRLTEEAANTKTIMDNCRTELERIFGVQVSGFDPGQYFDGPLNLTMGKGLYEARYTLFLPQYGVSVSSAWTAVGTTTGYGHVIPATDSTYDLGSSSKAWRYLYVDELKADLVLGAQVKDDLVPDADSTYDLGSSSLHWAEVHLDGLYSDGNIILQPSGDTDDYIEIYTSGNTPYIGVTGGEVLTLSRPGDGNFRLNIQRSSSNFFQIAKYLTYASLYSQHDIRIFADNDSSDYLYFSTATDIASLLPVEDKIHCLGSAALSYDHVYSDDFDNTSPFEKFAKPLDELKKIKDKKKDGKDVLDYESMPDFVRSHTRDPKKNKYETYIDDNGDEQQRVIERGPKDIICDEGWSINRMVVLLYQAVQELTAKVEALEAK